MGNSILRDKIVQIALKRRQKELEMMKMKSEMRGEMLVNVVKTEWLELVSLENAAIDQFLRGEIVKISEAKKQ
jgi:hypothetical protein